jgi:hypothetical protein
VVLARRGTRCDGHEALTETRRRVSIGSGIECSSSAAYCAVYLPNCVVALDEGWAPVGTDFRQATRGVNPKCHQEEEAGDDAVVRGAAAWALAKAQVEVVGVDTCAAVGGAG